MNSSNFIRNFDADRYFEIFFVSAIFSILGIRLFLELTGYPQIGNSDLHIAHMLWGGLLMMISILILLFFLTKHAQMTASFIGGVGFGTFIDEIGKFVTQDNDYFYEPSVALMYITFVLMFIAVNTIQTRWGKSEKEYIVNALNELKEIPSGTLDQSDKDRAINYLYESGASGEFIDSVKKIFSNAQVASPRKPGRYTRIKKFLSAHYENLTRYRFFNLGLILFFVLEFAVTITYIISLTFLIGIGWDRLSGVEMIEEVNHRLMTLSFIEIAEFFSSLLSGLFVFAGIYLLRKSRLRAYIMFKRSVLVSIFLTQFFLFYKEQFSAMTGLLFNILILVALEFMIDREKERAHAGT